MAGRHRRRYRARGLAAVELGSKLRSELAEQRIVDPADQDVGVALAAPQPQAHVFAAIHLERLFARRADGDAQREGMLRLVGPTIDELCHRLAVHDKEARTLEGKPMGGKIWHPQGSIEPFAEPSLDVIKLGSRHFDLVLLLLRID